MTCFANDHLQYDYTANGKLDGHTYKEKQQNINALCMHDSLILN